MKKRTYIVLLVLISCSPNKISNTSKEIVFKNTQYGFSIDAPLNWEYVPAQGMDSYIGNIQIGDSQTIHFDMGYYSNSLEQPIFKQGREIDNELIKTKKTFERINGLNAKIVFHSYENENDFGIYFDSLWTDYHNVDSTSKDIVQFVVYGKNLLSSDRGRMEKVFRTVRFLR